MVFLRNSLSSQQHMLQLQHMVFTRNSVSLSVSLSLSLSISISKVGVYCGNTGKATS